MAKLNSIMCFSKFQRLFSLHFPPISVIFYFRFFLSPLWGSISFYRPLSLIRVFSNLLDLELRNSDFYSRAMTRTDSQLLIERLDVIYANVPLLFLIYCQASVSFIYTFLCLDRVQHYCRWR